jgi:hypothetical protein
MHDGPYKTIADVEYATAGWVDWYNSRRLHSTLESVPPIEHEQAHYAALDREPHPVKERQRTWDASQLRGSAHADEGGLRVPVPGRVCYQPSSALW